ncbi:unnamed protein product [Eruca vesicaria subsp. sativa]|uniref:Auxin-responsive protein n=1 Tax=Eruca vesicaria subsp. sativa TaxID=29727 RepID=A0ABC8K215_ERUVS|nr:unnamed protein product [Eruca vesicaria subsp. sativa]
MDGAPYLRKVYLKTYKNYPELLKAVENMLKFTNGEYNERKGIKDLELYQRTRIKIEIGCWLVMFHGICFLPLVRDAES